MLNKLVILNGTEGHTFEVGKEYVLSDLRKTVGNIAITHLGYRVWFDDVSYVDVISNNVLAFSEKEMI